MEETNELDRWISVSEASTLSGYGMDWIRELAKDKKIVSIKKGHMVLIYKPSLELYKQNEDKKTQLN